MTEQDGADQGDADEEDAAARRADDGAETDLDDIASEPDGDADRRLADIAADAVEPPEDASAALEEAFEPGDLEVDDALVDRVEAAPPEEIAREVATLQLRVAALEGESAELQSEIEDLESRLKRKQADFQNYKKRQQERMEEEKQRATEDLVGRLLEVRDNLTRALDQDADADIRGGVESTLRQFDQELEKENVAVIDPDPGDGTDPQRHEVLMRVESDQPEGTVADVHRPGYEMAGKVLRPAQVTVSESSDEAADD